MLDLRHPLVAVAGALLLTIPWVGVELLGEHPGTTTTVLLTGLAVLGASFLLAWAAETAEEDVPRAFALAVLAVLAVAPEYAVDAFYAWNAGINAGTPAGQEAANLAIANMTGANRILIGLGWSGIALFTVYRVANSANKDPAVADREGLMADSVVLDRGIATEIAFLFFATAWAFFVPFGGGIDAIDTIVLVGIYATYILIIVRAGAETDEQHVGVPAYFQQYGQPYRTMVVLGLFAYSAAMIFTAVEPFAHGLEDLGLQLGIPSFFMIQWIAPLASESPELIVVVYLVNKARSTAGFNALISSKLNQWTLLIGTLAVVYSIALGAYAPLPFDAKQEAEIWLTAAQSFFALSILVNFEISVREALTLLVLFLSQVVIEFLLLKVIPSFPISSHGMLLVFTGIYVVLGTALFVRRRRALGEILRLTRSTARAAISPEHPPPEHAD
ncbi:sodium:calcium antiporter [Haloarculaceae archaeon H-GB2-1]|nr:sodium:calcium antiporter [Haloarculaceae archaeon H-GB1-1]MEA5386297.1 sodium:calcium antiporter [Haloarculaceae archaeon H-GB11]MEA5407801.1 sodium:calcium antiporter [Haloarculaceae archaeon H-GB2-1]